VRTSIGRVLIVAGTSPAVPLEYGQEAQCPREDGGDVSVRHAVPQERLRCDEGLESRGWR